MDHNAGQTRAAVTINEHADPDVIRDLTMELNKVIPFDDNYYHLEDNNAAHKRRQLNLGNTKYDS